MIRTVRAILALVLLPALDGAQLPQTPPGHIILLRHAEKPADPENPHLSKAGVRRAAALVTFINTNRAMRKLGTPVAIFATRTTKHDDGVRTQETVAPLAQALTLSVQTPFLGKQYAELAKQVLADRSLGGKTIVICWNHEEITQLAAALGVTPEPPKWKGSVFDQVYVISYRNGKASLAITRY